MSKESKKSNIIGSKCDAPLKRLALFANNSYTGSLPVIILIRLCILDRTMIHSFLSFDNIRLKVLKGFLGVNWLRPKP